MQLLTVAEVGALLKLSKSKVYELKDRIGYLRIGGAVRFRTEDVEIYLDSCAVTGRDRAERMPPRLHLKHLT